MRLRVLIVDDSSAYRIILRRVLQEDPSIEVVGSAATGKQGLSMISELCPDLVTLDQEMPDLNGLEVLTQIMSLPTSKATRPKVLMLSSLTTAGAEFTLKALKLGALDFIAKPAGEDQQANFKILKAELLGKIKALNQPASVVTPRNPIPPTLNTTALSSPSVLKVSDTKTSDASVYASAGLGVAQKIKSRSLSPRKFEAIAIGCSTGGPNALSSILPQLCKQTELPIFITQHMPPMFTKSLADSLGKICSHRVLEASAGLIVEAKTVYLAPGGFHMALSRLSGKIVIQINSDEPENFCRPAVDVLFRSVAVVYGSSALAIILTGMGSDGTKGLAEMKKKGALALAQDEASSIVWGMPGSAVGAGHIDQVLPLLEIPLAVKSLCL